MILMYDTEGRNQELPDIKLSDIHFEGKSPYVVITRNGKKSRLVLVMHKMVEHFKKYVMSPDNAETFIKKYDISTHTVNKEVPFLNHEWKQ